MYAKKVTVEQKKAKYQEEKVLKFLNQFEYLIGYTPRVSITNVAKKMEIPYSSAIPKIMIRKGLIVRKGKSMNIEYYWDSIKPNIHMARQLLDAAKSDIASQKKEWIKKRKKEEFRDLLSKEAKQNEKTLIKPIKKEQRVVKNYIIQEKIISMFFGLIKIRIKYNYKEI